MARRKCSVKGCSRWEVKEGLCNHHFKKRWGFRYKGAETTAFINEIVMLMAKNNVTQINGIRLE